MGWQKGEVIMKAEPFAHVLSHRHRQDRCSFCLRRSKTMQCTACKMLRYCSRDCQRQDWRGAHKQECSCLRRVAPHTPTDSVLLMLRLVLKHMQGEDGAGATRDPGLPTFQHLMSHVGEIEKDAGRCDAFSKMCFTLAKLAGDYMQLPDTKTLLDIFGKMVINTFTIADEELRDVGSGVYLSPSCLDHRCTPSAVVTFQGRTLYVRAVDNIPCADPSQVSQTVFLSYVDQLAPSWERQQQLQQQYYFLCQCPRCHDSSLDKVMTSGADSTVTDPDDADSQAVKSAINSCQQTVDRVDQIKKSSDDIDEILGACRACLAKVKVVLSSSNVYLLRVLDRAFDAAINSALWEEALDYGVATLTPYSELLPPRSPNAGLQLMRVGKLQLWLDRVQDARHSLSQAETIIAVTHGKQSELYTQLTELLVQTTLPGGPSQLSGAIESS
ncbi:histone-lysine N-methyltransferase SMYD3-like [Littorina saxatilis]|uniref:histone-lysine N-methyltransferase SMYD3-like n=1 Tax=Littorina saxatilis TaxID=31220 RepID=UPI0038B5FC8C